MPTAPSEPSPIRARVGTTLHRIGAIVASATVWHYLTLAIGFALILYLQRNQWFFFDEWAFLIVHGEGIWAAHVGHWSTTPTLIYDSLRSVFGLHSYLPYGLIITFLHIAAAHLIWRISLKVGVHGWIATTGVLFFILFGSGSENIFWAFQIGYVGALVLGLLAFYLTLALKPTWATFALVAVITIFSLTWSGTAIPLVAATAGLVWWKAGWRRSLVLVALSAGIYLAWYLQFSAGTGPDTGGFGLYKLFVAMPQFIGVLFIMGVGEILPVTGLGIAIVIATAIWLVTTVRSPTRRMQALPAILLVAAALIFTLMTAYSRAALSVGSGRSPRYVYLVVLLLLPAFLAALSYVVRRPQTIAISASVIAGIAIGFQGINMIQAANNQVVLEQGTHRLLNAALYLYETDPNAIRMDAQPDPRWAPDLTMTGLADLYEGGFFDGGDFKKADLEQVRKNVLVAR